ncbi:MAG TPA: hypothetical protein PLA90_07760, partial [Candidatus Sumerlaeota bacterium]|nr:hypothetical protein [Candidatus Sumerlaeota bacterium]
CPFFMRAEGPNYRKGAERLYRTGFQPLLEQTDRFSWGDAPGWYRSRRWRFPSESPLSPTPFLVFPELTFQDS